MCRFLHTVHSNLLKSVFFVDYERENFLKSFHGIKNIGKMFTCSMKTIEPLGKGVKYVQSEQNGP